MRPFKGFARTDFQTGPCCCRSARPERPKRTIRRALRQSARARSSDTRPSKRSFHSSSRFPCTRSATGALPVSSGFPAGRKSLYKGRIALPDNRAGREGPVQRGHLVRAELDVENREVLSQARTATHAAPRPIPDRLGDGPNRFALPDRDHPSPVAMGIKTLADSAVAVALHGKRQHGGREGLLVQTGGDDGRGVGGAGAVEAQGFVPPDRLRTKYPCCSREKGAISSTVTRSSGLL